MATPASSAGAGEAATLQVPPADQPSSAPFRLGNRPALTGIRALAMATVLVYHANFGTMPGSWVALQIFFVLSGFLITTMLASEARRHGRISLTRFYSRRAVRLLPPLFLAVALVAIYASFVHVCEILAASVGGQPGCALLLRRLPLGPRVTPRCSASSPRRGRSRSRSSSTSSGPSCSPSPSHEDGAGWPTGWPRQGWCSAQSTAPGYRWPHHISPRPSPPAPTTRSIPAPTLLFFGCLLGLMAADGYFQRLPSVGTTGAHRGCGGGDRRLRLGAVQGPRVVAWPPWSGGSRQQRWRPPSSSCTSSSARTASAPAS